MFCHGAGLDLRDKGLLKRNSLQTYPTPFQTKVMSTIRLARDPATGKQQNWVSKPRFNAQDIHRKYKDTVLMKDDRLQELYISEIGLKKVLYEDVVVAGYRNVATVSLPGTTGGGTKPLQTELDASIPVRTPR